MAGTIPTENCQYLEDLALKPDGPVALCLRQNLLPVEKSRVIFPPTYANIGYNIDTLSDGTRVATIDSVGSQANRLEPIFKSDSENPDDWLVPQIRILLRYEGCGQCEACLAPAEEKAPKRKKAGCSCPRPVTRSLLDLAHRAADAVVQSSPDLRKIVRPAFQSLQRGDAGPLSAIAPTSLVFGVWDSRGGSSEKRPRLVRSTIRAWDVEQLHASAQFNSVSKLLDDELRSQLKQAAKSAKVKLSEIGLDDAPSGRVLGGVLARGEIVRETTINLVALRGLRGADEEETAAIRKYLFGLSLVAATADVDLYLREGCHLRYADASDQWLAVPRRGEPQSISLSPDLAGKFAAGAARDFRSRWPKVFGDKWPNLIYRFDVNAAKQLLAEQGPEGSSSTE